MQGSGHPDRSTPRSGQLFLEIDDFFDLGKEPAVDLRDLENVLHCKPSAESVADEKNPLGIWNAQTMEYQLTRKNVTVA